MVLIDYKCRLLSLAEWSRLLNIPYDTLKMRYRRGMRGEKLFRPVGQVR